MLDRQGGHVHWRGRDAAWRQRSPGTRSCWAPISTLNVETARSEIAWDNFRLLDFLAKHGFTPSQHLVPSKWVEWGLAREGRLGRALIVAVDVG